MNELVNIPAQVSTDLVADMSKSGDWLPRMQLYTSATKEVKRGLFPMNHYGIVVQKDTIMDVGPEIDVMPCDYRAQALDTSGEEVISLHDHTDPAFQAIAQKSTIQDSGCFYGLQFLLWVPSQKRFVTFLFGSKSSRPEAGKMEPLIAKMATMKSRLAESKKFQWQVPVVIACSTPPSFLPEEDKLLAEIEKFRNPPKSTAEKATPTGGSREQ